MADDTQPNDIPEPADEVSFEPITDEGETLAPAEQVKRLRERLKIATAEKQENLLGWQRMKADYANAQKFFADERTTIEERATIKIIRDILPVLDSFDLAMGNQESWQKVDASWRTGVEYIRNQLLEALAKHTVVSFGEVGEHFNPHLHQPLEHSDDAVGEEGETVTKIIQKGYRKGETIIRPAKVIIGSKN